MSDLKDVSEPYVGKTLPDNIIVCAANRHTPTGHIILGVRHCDEHMRLHRQQLQDPGLNSEWEQGFIDKFGKFHTRTEAWIIAVAANQIRRRCGGDTANGGTLYSENLY